MTNEQRTALNELRQKTLREAEERMNKEGRNGRAEIAGQSPFVLTPEGWAKLADDLATVIDPEATWPDDLGEQERLDAIHAWLFEKDQPGETPDEAVEGYLNTPSTE